MTERAQPFQNFQDYVDPRTGRLSLVGLQHFAQQVVAINSIPVSVSGEQVAGAGTAWTLANTPSGNVLLYGLTALGPVPLALGNGNAWNYTIDGAEITTEQAFEGVTASYEYSQA